MEQLQGVPAVGDAAKNSIESFEKEREEVLAGFEGRMAEQVEVRLDIEDDIPEKERDHFDYMVKVFDNRMHVLEKIDPSSFKDVDEAREYVLQEKEKLQWLCDQAECFVQEQKGELSLDELTAAYEKLRDGTKENYKEEKYKKLNGFLSSCDHAVQSKKRILEKARGKGRKKTAEEEFRSYLKSSMMQVQEKRIGEEIRDEVGYGGVVYGEREGEYRRFQIIGYLPDTVEVRYKNGDEEETDTVGDFRVMTMNGKFNRFYVPLEVEEEFKIGRTWKPGDEHRDSEKFPVMRVDRYLGKRKGFQVKMITTKPQRTEKMSEEELRNFMEEGGYSVQERKTKKKSNTENNEPQEDQDTGVLYEITDEQAISVVQAILQKDDVPALGSDELKERLREEWKGFVVHGKNEVNRETGEVTLGRYSDLDGNMCLHLLKRAGLNVEKVEYVAQGEYVEGKTNLDTGAVEGIDVRQEDSTVIVDHHGEDSPRDASAAVRTYELLVKLGLVERSEALNKTMRFVTQIDNFDYPDAERFFDQEFYFKNGHKTLLGLYRKLQHIKEVGKLEEFFVYKKPKTGKGLSPAEKLSDGLLRKFKFIYNNRKNGEVNKPEEQKRSSTVHWKDCRSCKKRVVLSKQSGMVNCASIWKIVCQLAWMQRVHLGAIHM